MGFFGARTPYPRSGTDRQSRHLVPDALIDPGRVYPNKHMVIPIHRPVDLPEFQDVRRAVPVLDDCLHRVSSSMHSIISCCLDPLSVVGAAVKRVWVRDAWWLGAG